MTEHADKPDGDLALDQSASGSSYEPASAAHGQRGEAAQRDQPDHQTPHPVLP